VLTCRDFVSELGDYLDAAQPAECVEIERHMAVCRKCRVLCETTRQTITLYKRICSSCTVPEEVEKKLKEAIARHCG
jgi:hypothetical protein